MTKNELKRLTYRSAHNGVCFIDHKNGNIIDVYDIKATKSTDDILKIVYCLLEKLSKYEDIGTPDECRVAMEKMKPKKPIFNYDNFECPCCYTQPYEDGSDNKKPTWCEICGQRLDWE